MKSILSKLWLGIISVVLTISLITWLFQVILLEKFYIQERKNILLDEGKKIASLVITPKDGMNISQEVIDEIDSFKSSFSFNIRISILDDNKNLLYPDIDEPSFKKHLLPANESLMDHLAPSDHQNLGPYIKEYIIKNDPIPKKRSFIEVTIPIKDHSKVVGNIILSSSLAPIKEASSILKKQLSIITWVSLIIATLLAFLLAKLFTNPILKITETSKRIAKGDFKAHVFLESKDEIRVLGDTINDLAIQLEQIEKFRREFIANTSHELKTPISLIRAYAELIIEVDDEENKDEHLQTIIDESKRLNGMVEDILYLSQMESGFDKPHFSEFSIIEVINRMIEKLSLLASKKNIRLTLEAENKDLFIYGDEAKLNHVFLNLVTNAINHSHENEKVEIIIKEMKNSLRVEVKDYGVGIRQEDLPYIWDRFYKVDKSRKRNDSGTGLGMAIVKNILESHNYKYGIESEINKGTCVWIEIPLKKLR